MLNYWLPLLVDALETVIQALRRRKSGASLDGKAEVLRRAVRLAAVLREEGERLLPPETYTSTSGPSGNTEGTAP